jgi:hypothetical protein
MPTLLFFMFLEGGTPSASPVVLWQAGVQLFGFTVG